MHSVSWPQVAALGLLIAGVVAAIVLRSPEVAVIAQLAQAVLPSIIPRPEASR